MKRQNTKPTIYISLILLFLGTAVVQAHTLSPNQYLIWGISSEDVEIPDGSTITEAVLTIHDFVPSKARFYLHLLDNPAAGVQLRTDDKPGNIFTGFGVPLTGSASGGKWTCRLSRVNQADSPLWDVYEKPFVVTLANSSTVSYSSGLLEFMDYIGNGGGFGFGFDFIDVCTFTQITLDITVKSFEGDYREAVLSYPISAMYAYDSGAGTWVYQDGQVAADWEGEQDPYLPMTITRCQVTAGNTIGQDTLAVIGRFTRVHPNLLSVPSIGVSIVSAVDDAVVYTDECGYTWDLVRNRFNWSYKLGKNEAGRITSLTLDFTTMTFAMQVARVNLTGLSSPVRFDITLGSYLLSGEVDESIINGARLIPIRLMRNYGDELRVTKVSAKLGKTAGTDQLSITGELAVDSVDTTDLTTQDVVLTWGGQTFTIPAGSFKAARTRNVYSCRNAIATPSARVSCKMDFNRCTFTIKLDKTTLNVTSGTAEFRMQFAGFDERLELNL